MPAFGVKTNERPGTRAMVRHARMSAYKAREKMGRARYLMRITAPRIEAEL